MKEAIEKLIRTTRIHIENEIEHFKFDGYFDGKPYERIRNRLAEEYADDFLDAELQEATDAEVVSRCASILDEDPYSGGWWQEGAEDFIWGEIEEELKKNPTGGLNEDGSWDIDFKWA